MTMPADEASFEGALADLVRVATESHDNSNTLQGQEFADERGWLSSAEQADMERRRAREQALGRDLDDRVERIARDHVEPWCAWLDGGIAVFTRLGNDALCEAWRDLRDGRPGRYSRAWAIDVGATLLARHAPELANLPARAVPGRAAGTIK